MYGLNRQSKSLLMGISPTIHLKSWDVPVYKIDDFIRARAVQDKFVLVLMDIEGTGTLALECGKVLLNTDPNPICHIFQNVPDHQLH